MVKPFVVSLPLCNYTHAPITNGETLCTRLHKCQLPTHRDAGLFLPSQRTLRDYTYCTKSATGFSSSVDEQLLLASKVMTCKEWEKYVVVLVDEMHIRYI